MKIGSLSVAFGRELFKGEKTRDLTAKNSEVKNTIIFAALLPKANSEVTFAIEGNERAGNVTNGRVMEPGRQAQALSRSEGIFNVAPDESTKDGVVIDVLQNGNDDNAGRVNRTLSGS